MVAAHTMCLQRPRRDLQIRISERNAKAKEEGCKRMVVDESLRKGNKNKVRVCKAHLRGSEVLQWTGVKGKIFSLAEACLWLGRGRREEKGWLQICETLAIGEITQGRSLNWRES